MYELPSRDDVSKVVIDERGRARAGQPDAGARARRRPAPAGPAAPRPERHRTHRRGRVVNIIEALAWLDARLDHETSSPGIAAGRVDGLSLAGDARADGAARRPAARRARSSTSRAPTARARVAAMVTSLLHGPRPVGRDLHQPAPGAAQRAHRAATASPSVTRTWPRCCRASPRSSRCWRCGPAGSRSMTAAAFRWFAEAPVDVAVVEVGLLGRFDATNVVDARVAVVTSIGGDHTDFAPGWEVAVASEKAGIIGPDSTAVLGPIDPELRAGVQRRGPRASWCCSASTSRSSADQLAVGGHMVDVRRPPRALRPRCSCRCTARTSRQRRGRGGGGRGVLRPGARPDELVREGLAAVAAAGSVRGGRPPAAGRARRRAQPRRPAGRWLARSRTSSRRSGRGYVVLGMLAGRDADAAVAAMGGAAARPGDLHHRRRATVACPPRCWPRRATAPV